MRRLLALALAALLVGGQASTNSNMNVGGGGATIAAGSYWYSQTYPNFTITGDTAEHVFTDVPVPPGAIGPTGILRITLAWTANSNANAKTVRVRFGSVAGSGANANIGQQNAANNTVGQMQVILRNAGATGSQAILAGVGTNPYIASANTLMLTSVDTTQISHVTITGTLAVGTDTMTLLGLTVEALHP